MEVHNALVLFRRSTQWGFRYTTYISDGDCKVYPKLKAANIYGADVLIEKMECANHLAKRAKNQLIKFGSTYTEPTAEYTEATAESDKDKGTGNGKGKVKGKKEAENTCLCYLFELHTYMDLPKLLKCELEKQYFSNVLKSYHFMNFKNC